MIRNSRSVRSQCRGLSFMVIAAVFAIASASAQEAGGTSGGQLGGADIVSRCDNKYPGDDQKSQLTIKLADRGGNERQNVYLRLWKDYKGKDGIAEKMVLFTLYPPDAEGAAFMRWAYVPDEQKKADQWIYLPGLRKIRRVSVRDLADSFLGSDLTYGDITLREVDDDEHRLVRIDRDKKGHEYFVVESRPKEPESIYSKKVNWYRAAKDWDQCVKVRVDYYDRKGAFLKRQILQWQKVGPAWVWDKVFVRNVQTFHTSFFEVSKVEPNIGLEESWFTERRLRLGIK